MATATKDIIRYRKTQQGEWVVCGPASVIRPGATVTVTKADGTTKTETIARCGKVFDGRLCYGYLDRTRSSGWVAEHGRNGRSYYHGDSVERCFYGHTNPKPGCTDCFDTFDF